MILTAVLGSPMTMSSEQAVIKAKQTLSQSLSVDETQLSVKAVTSVQWPDSSLGCPQRGMMYAQVIMAGYKVLLELENTVYPVHVGGNRAVLCLADGHPNRSDKTQRINK